MNNKEIVKDFYEIFTELSKSFSFPYGTSTFEVMKLAESLLPPVEEMRNFTEEEQAVYNKIIEEMSTPILGANGKPINIFDI